MEENAPRKVGIVGLGQVGKQYTNIIRELGYEVVGVDANAKARREFKEQYGLETYEDLNTMYELDLDAVVVSTPNSYHEVAAVPALEHGLDTFIEKPLAHNAESAERIVDAASESDATCMVGYYLSFFEWVDALKSYIDDDYFGEISHIEGRYLYRRGVPRRGSWYTSKEIAGGGVLQDKGSFILHLLSYFGFAIDEIESITAKTRSEFGHRTDYLASGEWGTEGEEGIFDVEDSISVFLEFADGKTATIETAWAMNGPKEHAYQIRGTEAGATLDVLENELTIHEVDQDGSLVDKQIQPQYSEDVFTDISYGFGINHNTLRRRIFQHFCECAREGREPETGHLEQALDIQRTIADIYEAADDVAAN